MLNYLKTLIFFLSDIFFRKNPAEKSCRELAKQAPPNCPEPQTPATHDYYSSDLNCFAAKKKLKCFLRDFSRTPCVLFH
jgi:hypothetical protein